MKAKIGRCRYLTQDLIVNHVYRSLESTSIFCFLIWPLHLCLFGLVSSLFFLWLTEQEHVDFVKREGTSSNFSAKILFGVVDSINSCLKFYPQHWLSSPEYHCVEWLGSIELSGSFFEFLGYKICGVGTA